MDNDILSAYQLYPMQDGDVVLLVEELKLATEVEGLANAWDPVLCRNIAHVLREIDAREVQLGIARAQAALQARDHQLLGDLRQELEGSAITVHDLVALPAQAAA